MSLYYFGGCGCFERGEGWGKVQKATGDMTVIRPRRDGRYACLVDFVAAFGWSAVEFGFGGPGYFLFLSFSGLCLHGESERRCMHGTAFSGSGIKLLLTSLAYHVRGRCCHKYQACLYRFLGRIIATGMRLRTMNWYHYNTYMHRKRTS